MTKPLDLDELSRTHITGGGNRLGGRYHNHEWVPVCLSCGELWPCTTRQLLDLLAAKDDHVYELEEAGMEEVTRRMEAEARATAAEVQLEWREDRARHYEAAAREHLENIKLLEPKLEQARAALALYGRHPDGCCNPFAQLPGQTTHPLCDCGLNDARAALEAAKP